MITKGNVLLIFVTALILGIIALIFTIPFTVASNAGIPYIASIGSLLSFIIVGPISAITFTLLYLKLIRKPVPPPNYPPVQNQYGTNPPPNYPQ